MGTLTYKGATAKEALGSETIEAVPEWAEEQGFADNEEAVAGAELFAVAGCLQCHTYLGTGSSNLGAPDLTDDRRDGQGRRLLPALRRRTRRSSATPSMPPYAGLGEENLHEDRGRSSTPPRARRT